MSFEMENLFDKLIQSGSIGSDGIADNQHTDKTASVLGKTPPKKEEEDSVAPSPVVSRRGSSIDSDLATDDIDGLKKFTIPKQNKKGLLEVVDLGSREYLQDLYPLIQRSFRDPAAEKNFKFTKAWLVHNKLLQKVFYEKRKELTGREVQTSYAFLCSTSQSEVNRICSQGVNIGNCSTSCLGNPEMGVSLCRHADIVRQVPMQFGFSAKLIIFKIMKGKTMRMLESSAHLDPTPNCDCHVSKTANSFNLSAVTMLQAFQSTQIYLYEYGDLGIEQRPRQVLPHAVVEFTYIPDSTSQSSTKSSNVAAKSSVAKSAKKPTSKRGVKGAVGFTSHRPPLLSTPPGSQPIGGAPQERKEEQYGEMTFSSHGQCLPPQAGQNVHSHFSEKGAPQTQPPFTKLMAPQVQSQVTEQMAPAFQSPLTQQVAPQVQKQFTQKVAPLLQSQLSHQAEPHANVAQKERTDIQTQFFEQVQTQLSQRRTSDSDHQALISQTKKLRVDTDPHGVTQPETRPVSGPVLGTMDMGQQVSEDPKPRGVLIWRGEVSNRGGFLCGVEMISYGLCVKPARIGNTMNISTQMSVKKVTQRYLTGLVMDRHHEVINNGFFYNYCELRPQGGCQNKFNSLLAVLLRKDAAIIVKIEEADALLFPNCEATHRLGLSTPSEQRMALHCVFISEKSRVEAMRDKVVRSPPAHRSNLRHAQRSLTMSLGGSGRYKTGQTQSGTCTNRQSHDYTPPVAAEEDRPSQAVRVDFSRAFGGSYDTTGLRQDASGSTWNHPFAPGFPSQPPGVSPVQGLRDASGDQFRLPPKLTRTPHVPLDHFDTGFNSQVVSGALLMDTKLEKGFQDQGIMQNNRNLAIARGTYQFKEPIPKSLITFPSTIGGTTGQSQLMTSVQQVQAPSIVQAQQKDMSVSFQSSVGNTSYTSPSPSTSSSYIKSDTVQSSLSLASQNNISSISMPSIASPQTLDGLAPPGGSNLFTSPRLIPSSPGVGVNPPLGISSRPGPSPKEGELTHKSISVLINQLTENIEQLQAQQKLLIEQRKMTPPQTPPRTPTGEQDLSPASLYKRSRDPRMAKGMFRSPDGATVEMRSPPVAYISNSGGRDQQTQPMDITMVKSDSDFAETVPHSSDAKSSIVVSQTGAGALRTATSSQHSDLVKSPSVGNPASTSTCKTAIANTNKTSVTITQTTLRPAVSSTLTSAGLLTSPAQTTGRSSVSTTQAMSISTGPIVSLTTPAKVDSPIMKDTMTTVSVERGLSSTTGTTMSSMSNIEMVRSTQKTHMALNMASNTEGLTSTTMKTGLDNEKSKGHKDLSKGGNNTNLSQKIDYTKRQNYPVESPTKESIRDIQLPPGSPKYPSPRIFPPGGATQGMGKTLNSGISLEKKVFPSISSRDPRVVSQVTAQTAGSVPQTIQSLTKDRHLSGEEKISDTRNVSSLSDVEADKIVKRIPRTVSQNSRNATEIDMKKQYASADTQSTVTTDKQKEVQSQQTHLSNLNTRNNLSDSTSRSKPPTSEQQKLSSKVTPVAISPVIGSNSQTSQSKRDADYIESADDMRALLDSTITVATTDMAASPSPVKTVDPPFKKKELLVKNSEPGDKKEEVSVKIGGKSQVKSTSVSSKQAELLREKAEKSLEKGGMLAKTVPPSAASLSATASSTVATTGSQKSSTIKSMDTKQNILKNFRIPKISEGCAPTTIPFEIPRLAESIPVPSAVETEGVEKKVKETGEMRDGKPVGLQEKRCGPMLGSRPFLSEEPANKKAKPSSAGSTDTQKSLPKMVLASLTKSNRIDDSELSENEAPKEFKGLGSLGGSFKVTITKTETPTRSSGLKKNLALKKAIMFLTSIAPRYNNFTYPIQDEELAACRAGAFSNVHIKVGSDGHHDVTVTFHQDVDDQGSDQKALTSDPTEVLATTVREAIHKKSTLQLSATELYMQNLTNIAVHHLMPDEESSSPEPEQCLGDTQGNISSDVSSVVEEKREPAVLSKGKVVEHLTEGHGPFGMMSPSQDATVSSSMGTPPKTFQIQTTKMSAEMPTKLAMPQLPCSPIRSSPAGTPTKVTKVTGAPLESTPLKTGPSLCGPEIQTEGEPSTEKNNDITDVVPPKGDGRKVRVEEEAHGVDQPLAKSPSVSMVSVDRQKRRHHPYLPSLPKPEVKSFKPASDLQELMQSLHSAAFKGRRQAACNADSLFLQRLAKKLVRGASPRFAGFDFLQKMCKDGSSLSRSGNDEDESQPIKPSDIPDFERRKELTRQLDAELERQPEVDNEGEYELEVSLYSKKDDQPDTVKYQGDGEKPKAPSAITLIVQPPAATAVPSATKDGVSGIKSPGRSPISPRSPYIWDSSVSSPKWPPEKSLNLKPIDFEFRDIEYTPNPLVLHLAVLEIHYDAEKDPRLRCQSSKLYGKRQKLIRSISTPEKKMSSPGMRQVRTLSAEQNQADVKNTEASSLLGTPLYRSKSESKNTESSSVGVPHHSSQSVLKKKTSPLKTEASFQEHGDSKHNADLLAAAKAELHLVDQQIEELKKKLKFQSKSQQGDGDSGMESSTLNKTEKVEGAAQLQTPEVATVKLEKDQTPVHPESFKIDSSSPGMPEGKLSKQVIKRNLPKRFSTVEKVSWWLEGGSDVSAEEIAQYADSELDGAMDDASSRTEPAEDDENQGAALDDMLSRNTVAVSSRTESMIEAGMGGNLTASTVCMEITSQDKDGNQHLRHSASSSAADVEVLSSLVPLPPTLPQRRKLAEMAPMLARKTGRIRESSVNEEKQSLLGEKVRVEARDAFSDEGHWQITVSNTAFPSDEELQQMFPNDVDYRTMPCLDKPEEASIHLFPTWEAVPVRHKSRSSVPVSYTASQEEAFAHDSEKRLQELYPNLPQSQHRSTSYHSRSSEGLIAGMTSDALPYKLQGKMKPLSVLSDPEGGQLRFNTVDEQLNYFTNITQDALERITVGDQYHKGPKPHFFRGTMLNPLKIRRTELGKEERRFLNENEDAFKENMQGIFTTERTLSPPNRIPHLKSKRTDETMNLSCEEFKERLTSLLGEIEDLKSSDLSDIERTDRTVNEVCGQVHHLLERYVSGEGNIGLLERKSNWKNPREHLLMRPIDKSIQDNWNEFLDKLSSIGKNRNPPEVYTREEHSSPSSNLYSRPSRISPSRFHHLSPASQKLSESSRYLELEGMVAAQRATVDLNIQGMMKDMPLKRHSSYRGHQNIGTYEKGYFHHRKDMEMNSRRQRDEHRRPYLHQQDTGLPAIPVPLRPYLQYVLSSGDLGDVPPDDYVNYETHDGIGNTWQGKEQYYSCDEQQFYPSFPARSHPRSRYQDEWYPSYYLSHQTNEENFDPRSEQKSDIGNMSHYPQQHIKMDRLLLNVLRFRTTDEEQDSVADTAGDWSSDRAVRDRSAVSRDTGQITPIKDEQLFKECDSIVYQPTAYRVQEHKDDDESSFKRMQVRGMPSGKGEDACYLNTTQITSVHGKPSSLNTTPVRDEPFHNREEDGPPLGATSLHENRSVLNRTPVKDEPLCDEQSDYEPRVILNRTPVRDETSYYKDKSGSRTPVRDEMSYYKEKSCSRTPVRDETPYYQQKPSSSTPVRDENDNSDPPRQEEQLRKEKSTAFETAWPVSDQSIVQFGKVPEFYNPAGPTGTIESFVSLVNEYGTPLNELGKVDESQVELKSDEEQTLRKTRERALLKDAVISDTLSTEEKEELSLDRKTAVTPGGEVKHLSVTIPDVSRSVTEKPHDEDDVTPTQDENIYWPGREHESTADTKHSGRRTSLLTKAFKQEAKKRARLRKSSEGESDLLTDSSPKAKAPKMMQNAETVERNIKAELVDIRPVEMKGSTGSSSTDVGNSAQQVEAGGPDLSAASVSMPKMTIVLQRDTGTRTVSKKKLKKEYSCPSSCESPLPYPLHTGNIVGDELCSVKSDHFGRRDSDNKNQYLPEDIHSIPLPPICRQSGIGVVRKGTQEPMHEPSQIDKTEGNSSNCSEYSVTKISVAEGSQETASMLRNISEPNLVSKYHTGQTATVPSLTHIRLPENLSQFGRSVGQSEEIVMAGLPSSASLDGEIKQEKFFHASCEKSGPYDFHQRVSLDSTNMQDSMVKIKVEMRDEGSRSSNLTPVEPADPKFENLYVTPSYQSHIAKLVSAAENPPQSEAEQNVTKPQDIAFLAPVTQSSPSKHTLNFFARHSQGIPGLTLLDRFPPSPVKGVDANSIPGLTLLDQHTVSPVKKLCTGGVGVVHSSGKTSTGGAVDSLQKSTARRVVEFSEESCEDASGGLTRGGTASALPNSAPKMEPSQTSVVEVSQGMTQSPSHWSLSPSEQAVPVASPSVHTVPVSLSSASLPEETVKPSSPLVHVGQAKPSIYVFSSNSMVSKEVQRYLVKRNFKSFDPVSVSLMPKTANLVVLIHKPDLVRVQAIPNLLQLKSMHTVQFHSFDDVQDIEGQRMAPVLRHGGILIPDSKILLNTALELLEALCTVLVQQAMLGVSWKLMVHSSFMSSLSNLKISQTDPGDDEIRTQKADKILEVFHKYKEIIEYLEKHECDDTIKASPSKYSNCILTLQREYIESCRHVVLLSDISAASETGKRLNKSGIELADVQSFLKNRRWSGSETSL